MTSESPVSFRLPSEVIELLDTLATKYARASSEKPSRSLVVRKAIRDLAKRAKVTNAK